MWFFRKRAFAGAPHPHSESARSRRAERTGELGEYKLAVSLRQFGPETRLLSDLLIPNRTSHTGYSQIDHVLVTPHALFVLACKNFGYRVKGSADHAYWWSAGHRVFSPLKQNQSHIRGLSRILRLPGQVPMVSVVSFSLRAPVIVEGAALQDVGADEWLLADVRVPDYIERRLALCRQRGEAPLSRAGVEAVAAQIAAANITDPTVRQAHIDAIHRRRVPSSPPAAPSRSARAPARSRTAGGGKPRRRR